jgi:hypothetical protein
MATATASKGNTKAKAAKGATEPASGAVGVTQLAEALGTDGRTLRKFLRSQDLASASAAGTAGRHSPTRL